MRKKVIGIYSITNLASRLVYIGQSIDIFGRIICHKSLLKYNKHYNAHLQSSYNKHGIETFDFSVLELCNKKELSIREQYWIDLNKGKVYNSDLSVQSKFGENNPFFGKFHTEKTKKKISMFRAGKFLGKNNPNFGTKNDEETRKKMALNRARKILPKDVTIIRKKLAQGVKHKEIAKEYNVTRTTITRIKSGTRYALLGEQV